MPVQPASMLSVTLQRFAQTRAFGVSPGGLLLVAALLALGACERKASEYPESGRETPASRMGPDASGSSPSGTAASGSGTADEGNGGMVVQPPAVPSAPDMTVQPPATGSGAGIVEPAPQLPQAQEQAEQPPPDQRPQQ